MRLYYTGADVLDTPQTSAEKSLGGFRSSTMVPNGGLNVLFSDISYKMLGDKPTEVRALVLKNTGAEVVINVSLYTENQADVPFSKIEIAPVSLVNGEMERVSGGKTLPFDVIDWYDLEGESEAAILVAELEVGESIGIWIRRTILESINIPAIPRAELQTYYDSLTKKEEYKFEFSWE